MTKIREIAIIMLKSIAFLAAPLFVYLFIVNSSLGSIGNIVGEYTPSDEEINYLASLSVYRGEGLYHNFSIVYPPGRFIAQSLFFHLTAPTIPMSRVFMNLFAPLLFPTLIFFLSYTISRRLKLSFFPAYLLGWVALLFDILLVHSAQEIHVVLAAFCLVLLSKMHKVLRQFLLGILLALVFLFRFDAGIITVLSLLLVYRIYPSKSALLGFSTIWLPVLLHLLIRGTLINFLYDTIVLGLIVIPRTMGEAIPGNALWYVFLSSLILLFSLAISLWQKGDKPLQVVSGIALLSYMSALGRSDEGHLWYGLIWLSPFIAYGITQIRAVRLLPTLLLGATFLSLSYLIIVVKSPVLFLVIASISLLTLGHLKHYARETALAGLLSSLLIFHSFQYFTLRFQRPIYIGELAHPWSQSASGDSLAGLTFPLSTLSTLSQVKAEIVGTNPTLFIFPQNTLYYEYFGLPRPTRYNNMTGERTDKTEKEIVSNLESASNLYVLIFPDKAAQYSGAVWSWIGSHTKVIYSAPYQSTTMELRRR